MHDPNHEYSDDCEGCQPAMLDVKTGKPLPKDDPAMVVVLKAWKERTTFEERRATTRVWMGQSTTPADMAVAERVGGIMQEALKENADEVPGSDQ